MSQRNERGNGGERTVEPRGAGPAGGTASPWAPAGPNRPVRLGLAIPQSFGAAAEDGTDDATWLELLEAPVVDSLWVLDQLAGRARTAEALALLSYAAARTTRVRLGAAVLVGPARGPLATAKAIATIDHLAGGRLDVGVGLGAPGHYPAYGITRTAGGGPGDALDEALLLLRRLWTEDAVDHDGRWWTFDGISINPKPLQTPHPPLWIGGGGDRALARAAAFGHGWIGAGRHGPSEFAANVARLDMRLEAAGRSRPSFRVAKRAYVLVEPDAGRAATVVRGAFGAFYGRPELGAEVTVVGDAASCAEQLAELVAAGADEVLLHPVLERASQYEALVADVIPRLRRPG